MKQTLIIVLLFFAVGNLYSQSNQDTTITENRKSNQFVMTKSPKEAIIKSFVLPGWGQYYVESYWKIPVVTGAWGALIYSIVFNQTNYIDYRDQVNAFDGENTLELEILKSRREFYRDNRDIGGLYLMGVYAIAAIDAYVGAHLFDFNVDDDISMNISPALDGGISVGFTYRLY